MQQLATTTIVKNGFTFKFELTNEGLGDRDYFEEQWKTTANHEGGVTITIRNPSRNDNKYAIPLQTSLADLTKQYAQQKRANPHVEASESLKTQFERDSESCYVSLTVSIYLDEEFVLEKNITGGNYHYTDQPEEEFMLYLISEYFDYEEGIKEAAAEATRTIKVLQKVLDIYNQ